MSDASTAKAGQSIRTGGNVAEFSVSELANAIRHALEERFGYVRLRGEISGFRGAHASGHCYFALKDDKAKIEAVIWRGQLSRLKIRPEEGLEVIATGRITSYPASSKYQIVIDAMEPAGVGALMALLEERKRRLAAEGLFAAERKRRLPFLPRVIGIVTSPTGAVIRDMLAGFQERFPSHVIVWPVRVQGEGSAQEVAAAIRGFNLLPPVGPIPRPDLLIVARGGGSLEDLWGFNEEIVVRAAAESRIPLISAVGHETDTTLIDHAADARAPTPTKAAEWAVPKHSELLEAVGSNGLRLGVAVRRALESRRTELKAAIRGLPRPVDLVALPRQRFDLARQRLTGALSRNTAAHAVRLARSSARLSPSVVARRVERARDRLLRADQRAGRMLAHATGQRRARFERIGGRLSPSTTARRCRQGAERLGMLSERVHRAILVRLAAVRRHLDTRAHLLGTLSYHSVLARGYALVRDDQGRALRRSSDVADGTRLDIELAEGRLAARVEREPQDSDAPDRRPALRPAIGGEEGPTGRGRTARPTRGGDGGNGGAQGQLL